MHGISAKGVAHLQGIEGDALIADKAYDSKAIRHHCGHPLDASRKVPIQHDAPLYIERNRIKRCFNKLNTSGAAPAVSVAKQVARHVLI